MNAFKEKIILKYHLIIFYIKKTIFIFFMSSVLMVIFFRFVNPPITTLMFIRTFQNLFSEEEFRFEKEWTPIENISPEMYRAVIASEDQKFINHFGFDFEAIHYAWNKNNEKGRIKIGGSTISQQVAKNVFLWPGRSWIRKGFEAYFTLLIEILWDKKRIMEVYLNIVELGHGIYGVEAASQEYFKRSSAKISQKQCVQLTSILPAPRIWKINKPSQRLKSRQANIYRQMNLIGKVNL